MAHFYASIQGNRGEATRQGTADSGINGHIRGWQVGVDVNGIVDRDDDDNFRVSVTSGSGGYGYSHPVFTVMLVDGRRKLTLNKSILEKMDEDGNVWLDEE